jgi:hypothetical protein
VWYVLSEQVGRGTKTVVLVFVLEATQKRMALSTGALATSVSDSLEPSFELAPPRKVPHPHLPRHSPDTLVQLEDLEYASPFVLGSMLPGPEHERNFLPKHLPDVNDKLLDS